MTAIKVAPNELKSGLKQWRTQMRNEFKSYVWLGKAQTVPLQKVYDNPGLVIAILAGQMLKEWKR